MQAAVYTGDPRFIGWPLHRSPALRKIFKQAAALAEEGVLPPLIGRRAELIRMTQVLLQSRKNNLMLVGEPVGRGGLAAP